MTTQRCYYEILNLERTCTGDEIKLNYRKLALIWHPDKNQHQITVAEEKFKDINQAYQILSDSNERKWYDDHRESILRGGKGGADDEYSDNDINIWAYFSNSCFNGYDDEDLGGFYKVYQNIFDIIDKAEEQEAINNREKHYKPPSFGDSKTPIEEVLKFYSHWKDFVTCKKFTSEDIYQLSQAPNRQIKRLMEKENQKERSRARLEFNEKVRHLAHFVHTRDKRIQEYQQKLVQEQAEKQKILEEKQRKEEIDRLELLKKFKEERQAQYEKEKAEGLYDDIYDDEEDPDASEPHLCVICDKSFKSSRQLLNHENSNKHKQQLAKIKQSVTLDNDEIDIDTEKEKENEKDNSSNNTLDNTKSKKKKKKNKKSNNSFIKSDSEDDEVVFGLVNKSKSKKQKKQIQFLSVESDEEQEDDEVDFKPKNNDFTDNNEDEEEIEDEELISSMLKNFKIQKSKNSNNLNNNNNNNNNSSNNSCDNSDSEPESKNVKPEKKIGKAKEKRLQRAEKKSKQQNEQNEVLHCNACKEVFSTRNKLFQHINQTKHAQSFETPINNKKKK